MLERSTEIMKWRYSRMGNDWQVSLSNRKLIKL